MMTLSTQPGREVIDRSEIRDPSRFVSQKIPNTTFNLICYLIITHQRDLAATMPEETNNTSSSSSKDQQQEDYLDKGLDAFEKKYCQGKIDPQQSRGINEKITDTARETFEKMTGKFLRSSRIEQGKRASMETSSFKGNGINHNLRLCVLYDTLNPFFFR
ncbi:hypothetical protein VTN00DRAFT_1732 [Thermoascus crustaceus]|uniref:uncharacterized protein n=1 Tax=Thermoascus crustaceus TaxID=5088 RepID=UPI0037447910